MDWIKTIILVLLIWVPIISLGVLGNNSLHNKIDTVIENTDEELVDSLQLEVMELGSKLDSMYLKYDY